MVKELLTTQLLHTLVNKIIAKIHLMAAKSRLVAYVSYTL